MGDLCAVEGSLLITINMYLSICLNISPRIQKTKSACCAIRNGTFSLLYRIRTVLYVAEMRTFHLVGVGRNNADCSYMRQLNKRRLKCCSWFVRGLRNHEETLRETFVIVFDSYVRNPIPYTLKYSSHIYKSITEEC